MAGERAGLRWVIDLATGDLGLAVFDPDGQLREWWLDRPEVYEMAIKILAVHLALATNNGEREVGRLELVH